MSDMNAVNGAVAKPTQDMEGDDLATLLAKREHARPNKVTWVLLTLLVLSVGFVGGAVANQRFGSSGSSGSGFPPGFPAGFTPPGLSGGAGTAVGGPTGTSAGGFGGATFGTVKLVDGTNVYIATNDGATVKVKVPASASVTAQKDIPLTDLTAGTTVIVRGETGTDGTMTATSVSQATLPGAAPSAASPQPTTQGAN